MARKKYDFVENFIDPNTGQLVENTGSPSYKSTHWGPRLLHRIARIRYEEQTIRQKKTEIDGEGNTIDIGEETITLLIAKKGEEGGWIESTANLAQAGDCWVSGSAIVCDGGYVSGDVRLSGSVQVGEYAKVTDKAQVSGSVIVGGNAYIYKDAKVSGSNRVACYGHCLVAGTVSGSSTVHGNAVIHSSGQVSGNAEVYGTSHIYGQVGGTAIVCGGATVYGTVSGASEIGGASVIGKKGNANGARVGGGVLLEGNASVAKIEAGIPVIGKSGNIGADATISGNAFLGGQMSSGGYLLGNSSVVGKSSSIGGDAEISGNALIAEGGSVKSGCLVSNNVRIMGTLEGANACGNVSVAKEGSGSEDMAANGTVGPSGNGGATMNAVLVGNGTAEGNQVFEQSDDKRPEPTEEGEPSAAVVCKVDPGEGS